MMQMFGFDNSISTHDVLKGVHDDAKARVAFDRYLSGCNIGGYYYRSAKFKRLKDLEHSPEVLQIITTDGTGINQWSQLKKLVVPPPKKDGSGMATHFNCFAGKCTATTRWGWSESKGCKQKISYLSEFGEMLMTALRQQFAHSKMFTEKITERLVQTPEATV